MCIYANMRFIYWLTHLWDGLVTASCTVLQTSVQSSVGDLSIGSTPSIYVSPLLYSHKRVI